MALIYIVEDDESIREIEEFALKNSGHKVLGFPDAKSFYKQMTEVIPDLVLLDIMLPDENGNEIVKKLRRNSNTKKLPIIMVTAKTADIDLVKGLEDGADDYIKKPFSVMELITRVKALLRRTSTDDGKLLELGEIVLDQKRHLVYVEEQPVELTFKEFELLTYFMENRGIALSREKILNSVWNYDYYGDASRDSEVAERNNIRHAGFCPAVPLKILSE